MTGGAMGVFYVVAGNMGYYTHNKVDLWGLEIALSNTLRAISRPSACRCMNDIPDNPRKLFSGLGRQTVLDHF